VEKPTLLEVFAYVYFIPSTIVGPSFEYADFIQFIRLEGGYSSIPIALAVRKGFEELGYAVAFMLSVVFLSRPFDYKYCASKAYEDSSAFYKVQG
jgi:hypothetical protein